MEQTEEYTGFEIAVIGMACRFPGARNIDEFWENLKNGVEFISFLSEKEILQSGEKPLMLENPDYVKAKGFLEDIDYFDASFFEYSPREAEIMDPQVRLFHQTAWEALENAGYSSDLGKELIGIYAGANANVDWMGQLLRSANTTSRELEIANLCNTYTFCTRLSYKMNLRGPSVTVQTACSTSLAAIHMACQGLLCGECDIALTGGSSIYFLDKTGYLYEEGMILSPDGHCRTFDQRARGTIPGDGVGVVVLKRLEDAIADRDTIHAVVKGSGINNDGNRKVCYEAPSVNGQADLISDVYRRAAINSESIGYLEAHGTATNIGDPVEILALKHAFNTHKNEFCRIGSVKSNIGHLNNAAGVAGFIKTVLVLKYRLIPPSLHYEVPNSEINFKNSPFIVNTELFDLKSAPYPLRAAVNSLGGGGTNAHAVLEETPPMTVYRDEAAAPNRVPRDYKLILLSAKTKSALHNAAINLGEYFKKNPNINLADAAYTLQVGRKAFKHRQIMVCSKTEEAATVLLSTDAAKVHSYSMEKPNNLTVFMFPGQGAQYVNMGLDLYKTEPVFRREMDRCFDILKPLMGYDIKEILYPGDSVNKVNKVSEVSRGGSSYPPGRGNSPLERGAPQGRGVSQPGTCHLHPSPDINQTEVAQPLLFIFEYALAKLLMNWGIKPQAMTGHSIGEYVAAHFAGIFSLEDTLKLVFFRGKLMQGLPSGAMLGVPLSEEELTPLLESNPEVSLAAVNSSSLCVVSGPNEAVDSIEQKLEEQGCDCTRLHTSHAYHSRMMEPILSKFAEKVKETRLNKPGTQFISNVSGKWITAEEAVDPGYWLRHLRDTVRFADGLTELLKKKHAIFVEVGPGRTLSTFVKKHRDKKSGHMIITSIRHPQENVADSCYLLRKLGRFWLYGGNIDWSGYYSGEKHRRIPLPTYPFEEKYFGRKGTSFSNIAQVGFKKAESTKKKEIKDWFYIPSWIRTHSFLPPTAKKISNKEITSPWLVFMDNCGIGSLLIKHLEALGLEIIMLTPGGEYRKINDLEYTINPAHDSDYDILIEELHTINKIPGVIVHLWNIIEEPPGQGELDITHIESIQNLGFYSLLALAQALGKQDISDHIRIHVIANQMQNVNGTALVSPGKATVLGPCKIIPQEYPNISCRTIDTELPKPGSPEEDKLIPLLAAELVSESPDSEVAYRSNDRWVRTFEPLTIEKVENHNTPPRLKKESVYLVTGGLGGIGLIIAEYLVKRVKAKLVLIGRSALPTEEEWNQWLTSHDEDDPVSIRIRKVQSLEEMGGEVIVFQADVTQPDQMQHVIIRAEEKFGGINGVIHAAGLADGTLIHMRTRQVSEDVLAPKIKGALVLNMIFKDRKPDFFIFFSSLSVILAPMGQVAYCAANAFLDAFAFYKTNHDCCFTTSINWDAWLNVGMAGKSPKQLTQLMEHLFDYGLSASEGIDALERIMSEDLPQVVVSTSDLGERIEKADSLEIPLVDASESLIEMHQPTTIHQRPELDVPYVEPTNEIEDKLAKTFQDFLGIEHIGIHDNFFDLGATSLDLVQINRKINEVFGVKIPLVKLLTHTTIHSFAGYFAGEVLGNRPSGKEIPGIVAIKGRKEILKQKLAAAKKQTGVSSEIQEADTTGREIAVIGMAGRFPGAKNLDEFWENLKNGVESISFFSENELEESGVDPQLIRNPDYVKAKGVFEDSQYFDALFFDYLPGEAETMDPQSRIFHECAWEALEHAGSDSYSYPGLIGLYAGAAPHPFWEMAKSVLKMKKSSEIFSSISLSDKDFLATRIAYKLNLKGTAFTVSTACSTSFVAVYLACDCLLSGGCDMALAGGVSIGLPEKVGYFYEDGMILSADGHNRTFDEKACGCVFGDGVGVVLLKRLKDALADRDPIHAIIKGTAANNDGNRKLGFSAPSVEGQAQVIKTALEMAEIEPETIAYLEAHGTATALGDNVEMEALNDVFQQVKKKNFCAVGSVKSNVGHLNIAAGIAGLIKTVLMLKHHLLPPSLHFERSNPKIDFENGPFYVNHQLKEWKKDGHPRRAGVSSFGIGGTNVHAIIEEAPEIKRENTTDEREYQLVLLSAQTQSSLDMAAKNLGEYLKSSPDINLADAAYTLQVGRKPFNQRKMMVCRETGQAADALLSREAENVYSYSLEEPNHSIVFMFPGQGAQYVNMGLEIYRAEPVFRREMDRCFDILKPLMGYDIKEILYPHPDCRGGFPNPPSPGNSPLERSAPQGRGVSQPGTCHLHLSPDINQTEVVQPLLFIFEYALAKLLIHWGIKPLAMIGHSIGEYVAAYFSGVFSLEDALELVVQRGKLMQQMPTGSMLSVQLSQEDLTPLLPDELALAAVNGPCLCVVSGSHEAVDGFKKDLDQKGIKNRPLHTSHAFHSSMMEPILKEFEKTIETTRFNPPVIRYISNVSGTWITGEEVTRPGYWSNHLRRTVRFADGVKELLKEKNPIFVEVGPGNVLGNFVRKISRKKKGPEQKIINLVRHPQENASDHAFLLTQLGRLWLFGAKIDWQVFYSHEVRYRVALPSYPFERQYFWPNIKPLQMILRTDPGPALHKKKPDISDWFYIPLWKQVAPINPRKSEMRTKYRYIIFLNDSEFCTRLGKHLGKAEENSILVKQGPQFSKKSDHLFIINPGEREHYNALFKAILTQESTPLKIIHLWGVQPYSEELSITARFDKAQLTGFYSLVYLSQVLGKLESHEQIRITVVTEGIHDITGGEVLSPEKAMVLGPVITINQESPGIICQSIDINLPQPGHPEEAKLTQHLLAEFKSDSTEIFVAYRNNHRWLRQFEPVKSGEPTEDTLRLRKNGVYLITGGFGSIGFILARNLARMLGAKLLLTGRSPLPPETEWDKWLKTHETNDPVSVKIKKILELRDLGGEVLAFSTDVADREKMEQVVQLSEERFGPINGVIHAAGIVGEDSFFTLHETDQSMGQRLFQAKVHGTLTLEAVLRDKDLDFCLFMSSISSLLGGLGLTAYAAANIFMDTFAARHNRENCTNWLSINWDLWYQDQTGNDKLVNTLLGDFGITSEEGISILHRILSMDYKGNQLIISTGDLLARIEKWIKAKAVKGEKDKKIRLAGKKSFKLYKAPRNQVERVLIEIIQDYFGFEQIGIHDNFFDLGANSLDLVQINSKVNAVFENKIPLVKFFTFNSVSSFATYIMEDVLRNKAPGSQKKIDRSDAIQRGKKDLQKKSNKRRTVESK